MTEPSVNPPVSGVNEDILFECPVCTKSLQIDARGAGFMIECPDCHNQIQVPMLGSGGDPEEVERIEIEHMLNQLNQRVIQLEKQKQTDEACFKRLGDELVLIQAAIDRISEVVGSRATK
jgi:hypothetical protein